MRHERTLCGIYSRWLAQPGNSNVPNLSADEAVYEVAHQQAKLTSEAWDYKNVVVWRKNVRLMQQNQWLTRFIRAWEYFERTNT